MRMLKIIGGSIKWTLIVVGLLIVVVVVVAVASAGHTVDRANHQSAKVARLAPKIHLGETLAQVRSVLGKPSSTQKTEVQGETDIYWYYGELSTKGTWQFAFTNGKLTAKNRY